MAITTFVRKEKKYLITESQRKELLEYLPKYMEFDKYCLNGNKYTVNNIYFDTETFNVIRHSLSKPKYKEKLRVRSYTNEINDTDEVFLEVKKKFNGVVNKRRVILPLDDIEKYLNEGIRPNGITTQQSQIFDEIDYILSNEKVFPAVYLSYSRIAMFAKDNSTIRLTIDDDIITRTTELSLRKKRYGNKLLPDGYYLMEIKVNGAFPLWLANKLTELKIYPTSFSKYGTFYLNYVKEKINHEQ